MKIVIVLCLILAVGFGNVAYSEVPSNEVNMLISILTEKDKEVKKNAIRELGNLEDQKALEALNNSWSTESDEEVNYLIEIALNRIKLLDSNPAVRKSAAEEIGRASCRKE